MIDLGAHTPTASIGPQRLGDGSTVLGRLTTTDEQLQDAVRWVVAELGARDTEGRALIHWSRGEPTILQVRVKTEHVGGKSYRYADRVTEILQSGAEVPTSERARFERLKVELADLNEKGMI